MNAWQVCYVIEHGSSKFNLEVFKIRGRFLASGLNYFGRNVLSLKTDPVREFHVNLDSPSIRTPEFPGFLSICTSYSQGFACATDYILGDLDNEHKKF